MFICIGAVLFGKAQPHLILHFDINQTLIASDRAGGKSLENALNALMAGKYKSQWDSSVSEPISFEAYVKEILLPGDEYDQDLKKERRAYLYHFIEYLLENDHPFYPLVLGDYKAVLRILENSDGIVFPSFYRLLENLDEKQLSYTIVLRSFGEEVLQVMDEINAIYKPIIEKSGEFREGVLFIDDKPAEIYPVFHAKSAAIHDDWAYWANNNMLVEYGKPFYIDPQDPETLSIFFDDNIRVDDSGKNIISPRDVNSGKFLPVKELEQSGQVVCVDTLEAIVNENYYIDLVQKALLKTKIKEIK